MERPHLNPIVSFIWKHRKTNLIIFSLSILFIIFSGCSKKTPEKKIKHKELPITSAQQKLINICKNDYQLNIITKSYADTLWIYLPVHKSFIQIKATQDGPKNERDSKEKQTIHFLDGQFEDNMFKIQYDISSILSYKKSFGYSSTTTKEYQKNQRNILTAINRAYASVGKSISSEENKKNIIKNITDQSTEKNPNNVINPRIKKTKNPPDFFVIVLADTLSGIKTTTYIAYTDLKRVMQDPYFQEEYIKRAVTEQPIGNKDIIDDETGTNLESYNLTWGEFLIKQMLHRINFKYTQSAFPPSEKPYLEILNIADTTTSTYGFNDFTGLQLENLRIEDKTKSIKFIPKKDIAKYVPKKKPSQGRLYTIHFN